MESLSVRLALIEIKYLLCGSDSDHHIMKTANHLHMMSAPILGKVPFELLRAERTESASSPFFQSRPIIDTSGESLSKDYRDQAPIEGLYILSA